MLDFDLEIVSSFAAHHNGTEFLDLLEVASKCAVVGLIRASTGGVEQMFEIGWLTLFTLHVQLQCQFQVLIVESSDSAPTAGNKFDDATGIDKVGLEELRVLGGCGEQRLCIHRFDLARR